MTSRSSSHAVARRQSRALSGLLSMFAHGLRAQVSFEQQAEAHYWRIRQFAAKEATEHLRQAELSNKLVLQDLKIEREKRALGLNSAANEFISEPTTESVTLIPGSLIVFAEGAGRVVASDPAYTVVEWRGKLYRYPTLLFLEKIRVGSAVVIK